MGHASISRKGKDVFLLQNIQTCSGAHPASYNGAGISVRGVKEAEK